MAGSRPAFRYQITLLLSSLMLIWVLLTSLTGFWHLTISTSSLLKYTFWALLFAWVSWRTPLIAAVATVMGGAGVVYGVYRLPIVDQYIQTVITASGLLAKALMQMQFDATFAPILGPVFLSSIALLTALVLVWETFTRGRPFWAIVTGMVIFGTEWAWYYDAAASYAMAFGVLVFVIWAVGQAAVRDARWHATGRKVGNRILLLVPAVSIFLVAFLSAMLPDHYEPLNTGAWGERLQDAIPALKNMRGGGAGGGNGRFSIAISGFSPSSFALGGPVKLDDNVALHVALDQPLQETLYLRGATFTAYTGHQWQRGDIPPASIGADNSLVVDFSSDALSRYLNLEISHDVNLGNTVFAPLAPLRIDNATGNLRTDADSNVWSDRTVRRSSPYQVTARVPVYSSEQIRLLGTGAPSEADQVYLQLPDTTPPRVKDLAVQLTATEKQPYDKALILERYLRQFPYDLNAQPAPAGHDFVDYFLFDSQRGYCIYSATAMTILLREIGIPARLVQGFAIPASAQHTPRADGRVVYAVPNAVAHAWVEAKFPGYGWVTFDPTPRDDLPILDRSTPLPKSEESTVGSGTDDSSTLGEHTSRQKQVPEDLESGAASVATAKTQRWPWTAGALVLAAGLLYFLYRRLQSQERLVSKAVPQLVQEVWVKTDALLALFGFGRKPHETPQEYAAVVGNEWPDLKTTVTELAADYNQVRYGPADAVASDEVAPRASGFWEKMHEALFDRVGWRTYLWRRLRGRVSPKEATKKRK